MAEKEYLDSVVSTFSEPTKSVIDGNGCDYTESNLALLKKDLQKIIKFANTKNGINENTPSYAARSQGDTADLKTARQHESKIKQAITSCEMAIAKEKLKPEEKNDVAPSNIDYSSYGTKDVDPSSVDISHAEDDKMAKSTLTGEEDALKDTDDYIDARQKNLTKEEEKQYRKDLEDDEYGRNARINDNIARGSKGENANNRNFETTLRYSRLADALNNKVHIKGGRTSTLMGATAGGTMGVDGELSSIYQMPKIDTEEMRQQQTIRDLSKGQSERQISRQQNYRDAAQKLTEAEMQDKLKLQTQLSERLMNRRDKMTDEEMRQWYQEPYNEQMRRTAAEWDKKFERDFGIEGATFLSDLNKMNPTLAAIIGEAIKIAPPSFAEQFATEVLVPYANAIRAGKPVDVVMKDVGGSVGNILASIAGSGGEAVKAFVTSLFDVGV